MWATQLKTVALAKNWSSTQVDGAIREQLSRGHLVARTPAGHDNEERDARRLPAAAAPTATAAAGKAATTAPRTRARRCCSRSRGAAERRADGRGEARGSQTREGVARIPEGRVALIAPHARCCRLRLKLSAPLVFAIECDGVGQEALEHLRRHVGRVENFQAILFRGFEEQLETFDLIQRMRAKRGRRLQQMIEDICQHAAGGERQAGGKQECMAQEEKSDKQPSREGNGKSRHHQGTEEAAER